MRKLNARPVFSCITKWENSHFQNRKENVSKWVNNSVFTCYCYSSTLKFRTTYYEKSKRVSLFIKYERDQEKTYSAQLTSSFSDSRTRFSFCSFSLHSTQIFRVCPLFLVSPVIISNHCFYVGRGLKIDIPVTPLLVERTTACKREGHSLQPAWRKKIFTPIHTCMQLFTIIQRL